MMRWKREWTRIVFIFLLLRIVFSALGFRTAMGPPPERLATDPIYQPVESVLKTDPFSQKFVNVWMRWDTGWYLKIAIFGYSPTDYSAVFRPLFPLLIRGLGNLMGGNYLLAALLLTNLCGLIAMILLYEIAVKEGLAPDAANRVLIFYVVFPSTFFLLAAYSESPFLAALFGSWLLARHKRWFLAGLLAGVSTLIRMQGVVMTIVLGWAILADCAGASGQSPLEQIRQVANLLRTRQAWPSLFQPSRRWAWLGILLPLAAFFGYNLWLSLSGMLSAGPVLQTGWGNGAVMPWTGFEAFLQRLFHNPRVFMDYIEGPLFILTLGLAIYGLFHLDPALSLYVWLTLAAVFMRGPTPHLLDGLSRYFLGLFPLFLLMGRMRSPRLRVALWAFSFVLQTFLLMGFLDWRWVA